MSVSLTYGAFGDIITTIQLVARLVKALNDSRGSRSDFQDLVQELQSFQRVLQPLAVLWQSRRQSVAFEDLAQSVVPLIADCRDKIQTYLEDAVTKYGKSLLRQKGSRNGWRDFARMIQWNLCEKEEVEKLRKVLSYNKATMTLVQTLAQSIDAEQNQNVLNDRMNDLFEAEREANRKIEDRFTELADQIGDGLKSLGVAIDGVQSSLDVVGDDIADIKDIVQVLPAMMNRISLINDNVVWIEDAIGREFAVPLTINPSWHTIRSMIFDLFKNNRYPGLDLVKFGRYLLQDGRTGRDVRMSIEFYNSVRPGQKYRMSMIFYADWDEESQNAQTSECPSCRCVNLNVNPDVSVTCHNCSYEYRRVFDISDRDLESNFSYAQHEFQISDHDDSDAEFAVEDAFQDVLRENSIETFDYAPNLFKRSTLLTPWEFSADSRGKPWRSIGDLQSWYVSGEGMAPNAVYQMAMAIMIHLMLAFRGHDIYRDGVYTIVFVGRTLASSVLTILWMPERWVHAKQVVEAVKHLEWIKNNPNIKVAAMPRRLQYTEEQWEVFHNEWLNSRMRQEAQRKYQSILRSRQRH